MNVRAVADAIAARFVGVTATLNGETKSIQIGPTALLPNAIATGPALLVLPPFGTLDIGVSRRRSDELDFPVRLLFDPIDVPTRTAWLYAWIDATRDRVEMDMDLGLAYVAWAKPISLQSGIDTYTYAGDAFDGLEYVVRVHFNEVVTTVSA